MDNNKSYLAIISMIIGIISLFLSFFLGILAFIPAVIGFALGMLYKGVNGFKVSGIILNIASIIVGYIVSFFIFFLVTLIFSASSEIRDYVNDSSTFFGDNYTLKYGDDWFYDDDLDLLFSDEYDAYFMPFLDDELYTVREKYDCDSRKYSCKDSLYDGFYKFLEETYKYSFSFYPKDYDYHFLKNGMYYYRYKYTNSYYDYGMIYIVMSDTDEYITSFKVISIDQKIFSHEDSIIDILESIEFNSYIDDKYTGDLSFA